jgi:DNA end-binding protein Ku
MARAIWSGSVAFGLVNVPVQLFSATEDRTVHFHQFERGTTSRIRYRRVNEDTGEEVDYDDIVKGYDLGDGEYVLLTPEELEAVEPGRSRTIEITDFVDAVEIDPIYYQKTYHLAPADDSAAKAYQLLVRAMAETGRTAVATFVMRSKQYLAALRPMDDVLMLETMHFAEEVRDAQEEIDQLPTSADVGSRDFDTARMLIDAMTTKWDPSNYRDTYRDRVLELIEAKRAGEEVVTTTDSEPASAQVVDLMAKLQESVDAARRHRPGNGHQAQPIRRGASRLDDLADRSKADVYEIAQDLDIAGRSSMTKDELIEAIRSTATARRAS